jgi:hypothetical protein
MASRTMRGMMELLLKRNPTVDEATIGHLSVDDRPECDTLEDAIRQVKIPGRTCIPAGRYRITLENSPKFGPDTITINNVPGYTGIRMHAGNTIADTAGCPLVGKAARSSIVPGTSAPALVKLKAKILAAILTRREECWITVRNP